jgi:protein-S-isoprenylcysteine O-methyltransferase Ste14
MSAHTPKNPENRCLLSFLASLMACFSYSLFRFFVPTVRKPQQYQMRGRTRNYVKPQLPGAALVTLVGALLWFSSSFDRTHGLSLSIPPHSVAVLLRRFHITVTP